MGGHQKKVLNLQVFRVDYERSLVFIKGAVPGKKYEVVELTDAMYKMEENKEFVNYPTFVPEEGVRYANIVQMEPPIEDPFEQYLHDEALPKDLDEEE